MALAVPGAGGAESAAAAADSPALDAHPGGAGTAAVAEATALEALRVPEELSARVPAEQRGAGRDDVRLLVSRGRAVTHHAFRELPEQLRAGDVLV
ncbi:S-adenosylmethionine:tRNA ribosyltransferase-isomerase, partial [Streptomyces sp. SID7982]|nr:S-adenosylmethionine:tRNA ribosyltransferase-isomerase [Streptomyces sp. SID7982]